MPRISQQEMDEYLQEKQENEEEEAAEEERMMAYLKQWEEDEKRMNDRYWHNYWLETREDDLFEQDAFEPHGHDFFVDWD